MRFVPFLAALLILACSGDPTRNAQSGGDGGASAGKDAGEANHLASSALQACAELQAAGPMPTVADVVARLNALPRPVAPACFLASVPRPLTVVATDSTSSAQPAAGERNPRLFLMTPGMVLSLVPDGPGGSLLELGQWTSSTRTMKGETEFPVTHALAPDEPLVRVEQSNFTTTCGVCHREEAPVASLPHGYDSVAFRPLPGSEVSLEALEAEHVLCTQSRDTSSRCEFFHALFDFGEVKLGAFAREVKLFNP